MKSSSIINLEPETIVKLLSKDEQEINDSVGGSEGIGDGTPMSQYSSRGAARSVVNRIGVNSTSSIMLTF